MSRQSLTHSFACAFKGIHSMFGERNFLIEFSVGVVAVVLGFALRISYESWIVVIACIGLVLGLECVNTALENAVDLASPEFSDIAGKAKDAAAGGVLLASLASLVVGILVFAPRLLDVLGVVW